MWLRIDDDKVEELMAFYWQLENAKSLMPSGFRQVIAQVGLRRAEEGNAVHQAFKEAADEIGDDGELEIDDDAVVSLSENQGGVMGAYVMAWCFVRATATSLPVNAAGNVIDEEDELDIAVRAASTLSQAALAAAARGTVSETDEEEP